MGSTYLAHLLQSLQHQLLLQHRVQSLNLIAGGLGLQIGRGQDEGAQDERGYDDRKSGDLGNFHRICLTLVGLESK